MSDRDKALRWALRALGKREYFREELRQKLANRGFQDDVIDEVMAILVDQRLLSESRAAEAFIEARSGKRAVSREILQEELRERGADDSKVELAQRTDEEERSLMLGVITKFDDRARAGRLLARRGFDADLIASVLEQHFGAED